MSERLFLLAHISQEHNMCELKEKYDAIELSAFEEDYFEMLISYNLEIFGKDWNSSEHILLKLLYKKMKQQFEIKHSGEYNFFDLMGKFEEYITNESSLYGVINDLDYA